MNQFRTVGLRAAALLAVLTLVGCDIPGLGPDPRVAQREANARAVGAACRFGLRSIEDCYALNEGVAKADVYAGWREMDQYMRDNKLEGQRASAVKPEPVETIIEEPKPKSGKSTAKAGGDKPTATAH